MTWDDLEMVTFRQTQDGQWSFTVYRKPFVMWRSNVGLPDVFACMEQIIECLGEEAAAAAALAADASKVKGRAGRTRAVPPAGEKSKPAGDDREIRPLRGVLDDPPMQLGVKRRRPRRD